MESCVHLDIDRNQFPQYVKHRDLQMHVWLAHLWSSIGFSDTKITPLKSMPEHGPCEILRQWTTQVYNTIRIPLQVTNRPERGSNVSSRQLYGNKHSIAEYIAIYMTNKQNKSLEGQPLMQLKGYKYE